MDRSTRLCTKRAIRYEDERKKKIMIILMKSSLKLDTFFSQILAIKQVPVDTDLQEIIKEISIMQQCDSPYVVKYYGSYFKNTDLWVS